MDVGCRKIIGKRLASPSCVDKVFHIAHFPFVISRF